MLYQVEINGVPSWEVLRAHRPGTGSDLTYSGGSRPTRASIPTGGSISTLTELFTADAQGVRAVSGRQPGPATNDLFLATERADLIARGVAVDLHGTRDVAGRTCSLLRLKEPASGPIAVLSGPEDHDDLCLDTGGLVLSETWTYHGRVVLTRTAAGVWLSPAEQAAAGLPLVPSIAQARPASAAGATVTAASAGSADLLAPMAPTGFAALLPAQDFRLPDPRAPGQLLARSTVWSFARGADLITVEAGRERSGSLPWLEGDTPTQAVAVQLAGQAVSALRSDGAEIRVALRNGDWVRVRGTVSLAELTAVARALRPNPTSAGPTAG